MLVFAKVKYLITFADTFYFSWLQVMGNYLVYGRVFRSTTLATTWQHHQSLCLFLLYITREFPKTLKKKLNSMRVFIGQAALTFCSPSLSYSRGARGGGNSWEFLVEVCRPVLQILTLFQTKNIIFTPVFRQGL